MIRRTHKAVEPRSRESGNTSAPSQSEPGKDDACRCKETAEMDSRQLLGRMWSDLAFWKKTKNK